MMRWANETKWLPEMLAAGRRHGVPLWVIQTTIATESSFNPTAERQETGGRVSRGLMQVLEGTARGLGYTGTPEGLFIPATSIELGARLLAQLTVRYPGAAWEGIYAAYNSGAIRKDAKGRYVNAAGGLDVQEHVDNWQRNRRYFETQPQQAGFGSVGPLSWLLFVVGFLAWMALRPR